jgi:hypothetical protein
MHYVGRSPKRANTYGNGAQKAIIESTARYLIKKSHVSMGLLVHIKQSAPAYFLGLVSLLPLKAWPQTALTMLNLYISAW